MRIAYVANHHSGGSDDEGAIAYALTQLGHKVEGIHERYATYTSVNDTDLVLFHKWSPGVGLGKVRPPKVFWYFDLVDWPDISLHRRNHNRLMWMRQTIPLVQLGFCTDGDWVEKGNSIYDGDKLIWLTQGADERIVGRSKNEYPPIMSAPILFTGIANGGGTDRISFVTRMKERWGEDFLHINRGLYRERLRDFIDKVKIVVCPDSPVTHRYWSNRIYNACGFGATVLHPISVGLMEQYKHIDEIVFYDGQDSLDSKIGYFISPTGEEYRQQLGEAALQRTLKEHLYRHRVEKLLQVVKERLDVY